MVKGNKNRSYDQTRIKSEKMSLDIIIVCSRLFFPPINALNIHLYMLSKYLHQAGNRIVAFANKIECDNESIQPPFIKIVSQEKLEKRSRIEWLLNRTKYHFVVLKYIFSHRKNHLFIWCRSELSMAILFIPIKVLNRLRIINTLLIYDLGTIPWEEGKIRNYSNFRILIEKKIIILAHKIRVQSSNSKEVLIKEGIPSKKIFVIPVGCEIKKIKWKNPHNHKIVYIGGFVSWQGIETLFEAMKIVRKKISDAELIIVGCDGKKWEKNGIKSVGRLPHEKVFNYYLSASVFVIPRPSNIVTETTPPMKLMEAISLGIPIVASNVGGISEVVKHKQHAYLVQPESPEALAKGIIELLKNPTLSKAISENARKLAKEKYDWKILVKDIKAQLMEEYL